MSRDLAADVFEVLVRGDVELEEWQERLLRMRFGVPPASLREVAELFGVPLYRARQMENLALRAAGL